MWTYVQGTGEMISPSGEVVGTGYSGSPEGKNNTLMQAVKNVGPIPIGFYTMSQPINSEKHGLYAIPLTPDQLNEMFGRDEFLCHGDSIPHPGTASQGCIIQNHMVRVAMWESVPDDHRLQVVDRIP